MKDSDLERKLADLEKAEKEQANAIITYQQDIEDILKDIKNLEDIKQTLPPGCYNTQSLETPQLSSSPLHPTQKAKVTLYRNCLITKSFSLSDTTSLSVPRLITEIPQASKCSCLDEAHDCGHRGWE